MEIRKMSIDDYSSVKALWQECALRDEPEDERDEVAALLNAPQSTGFTAHGNGKIVGAVLCGSDGRYGYIHHLAVAEETRKQGIGRALADTCVRWMQKRHVIVLVNRDNDLGSGFWKHFQFQHADWLDVQFLKTR